MALEDKRMPVLPAKGFCPRMQTYAAIDTFGDEMLSIVR